MNLKRVMDIYEIIKNRLPKTYPRLQLAFYEDEDCMIKNNYISKDEGENVYAVFNPITATINLPMKMKMELKNKAGETITKVVSITKQFDEEIANTLLHEYAHALFGERYGYDSKQYFDEKLCDQFANRWVKILKKEKLI